MTVQLTSDDIRSLVYQTCQVLDDESYDKYLSLCAPEYQYQITAYSPEIRKEQTWLKHDRKEMAGLLRCCRSTCECQDVSSGRLVSAASAT